MARQSEHQCASMSVPVPIPTGARPSLSICRYPCQHIDFNNEPDDKINTMQPSCETLWYHLPTDSSPESHGLNDEACNCVCASVGVTEHDHETMPKCVHAKLIREKVEVKSACEKQVS